MNNVIQYKSKVKKWLKTFWLTLPARNILVINSRIIREWFANDPRLIREWYEKESVQTGFPVNHSRYIRESIKNSFPNVSRIIREWYTKKAKIFLAETVVHVQRVGPVPMACKWIGFKMSVSLPVQYFYG